MIAITSAGIIQLRTDELKASPNEVKRLREASKPTTSGTNNQTFPR